MAHTLSTRLRRFSQILLGNYGLTSGAVHVRNRPFYIFLEITNRCNIACIHCGRTHDPRYQEKGHVGDLSLELIRKLEPIIPYAAYVIPTGVGEPFLNRDLLPAVRFLKSCRAGVSVTSNGTILNDRLCREVVDSGLDKIVFSLDGARPESFNAIRAGADFDRVIRNIKNLIAIRDAAGSRTPRIEVEMIAMAGNFFDLPLLPDLAAELDAQCVLVETLFEHGGDEYGRILEQQSLTNIDLADALPVWERFLEGTRRHGLSLMSSLLKRDFRTVFRTPGGEKAGEHGTLPQTPDYQAAGEPLVQIGGPDRVFSQVFCTQPWSIIYVTWKGEVRTCCFNEKVLGDLNQNSIEEIWNGPAWKRFRRTILDERVPGGCSDCLRGGFNYNIVPRLEPAFLRRKMGELKDELVAAIR